MSNEKNSGVALVTPGAMIKDAMAGGASVEVIETLAKLYREEREDQRRQAYNKAIAQFQANCPDILKTTQAHNSRYAKLPEIIRVIREPLQQAGLTYRYEINSKDVKNISVTCFVTHSAGHSESATMAGPADTSGSKNAIQAIASTVAYMERYTLCGVLGIVTVDADTDGKPPKKSSVKIITTKQAADLEALAKKSNTDTAAMFAWAGCQGFENFPASLYAKAKARMEAKK